MVDVDVLSGLIDSMNEAISRLQNAQNAGDNDYVNRLRVFVYDVQQKIDAVLRG